MALAERIQSDLTAAMKARDTETVATLRMVVTAIKNARVAPGRGGGRGDGDVTDAETVELVNREAKRRREAADAYDAAGRRDLADKERRELAVLQRYLPEQLDEAELASLVDAAVAEVGASGLGDLGAVMSAVMPRVKGRADGRTVNAMVRARLQP